MSSYLGLDVIFTASPAAVAIREAVRRKRAPSKAWWLTLAGLLLLTAVFDNVIIALGVVTYNRAALLGIFIGRAPIEDFFYPLVAALIIPVLWNEKRRR